MTRRRRRHGCTRQDRGAAAVEFALVTPLLLIMLFGIVDYGIWFSDSISARQAVRDGARRGSVEQFGTCSGVSGDLATLACTVRQGMGQISGNSYVRAVIATDPASASVSTATPGAWKVGATLRVCAVTQHTSLLPFVPFPAGGLATTRVDIPIEQAGASAAARLGYAGDTLPPGTPAWADWNSWCR